MDVTFPYTSLTSPLIYTCNSTTWSPMSGCAHGLEFPLMGDFTGATSNDYGINLWP